MASLPTMQTYIIRIGGCLVILETKGGGVFWLSKALDTSLGIQLLGSLFFHFREEFLILQNALNSQKFCPNVPLSHLIKRLVFYSNIIQSRVLKPNNHSWDQGYLSLDINPVQTFSPRFLNWVLNNLDSLKRVFPQLARRQLTRVSSEEMDWLDPILWIENLHQEYLNQNMRDPKEEWF